MVGVIAAQVDHQGHVAQRIELVRVGPFAADDDRAGGRLDAGDDVPGDPRHVHVAAVRIVLQLIEHLRIGERDEGLGRGEHRAAVHLFHQVHHAAAGAAVVERMGHAVLPDHHGIDVRRQLADFALGERGERRGLGRAGLDQGLLDDVQGLLRRLDLGYFRASRFGRSSLSAMIGSRRARPPRSSRIAVCTSRVNCSASATAPKRMTQHVVVPGEPAVARQLGARVGRGGRIELISGIALEAGEIVVDAAVADRVADFLLQDLDQARRQGMAYGGGIGFVGGGWFVVCSS